MCGQPGQGAAVPTVQVQFGVHRGRRGSRQVKGFDSISNPGNAPEPDPVHVTIVVEVVAGGAGWSNYCGLGSAVIWLVDILAAFGYGEGDGIGAGHQVGRGGRNQLDAGDSRADVRDSLAIGVGGGSDGADAAAAQIRRRAEGDHLAGQGAVAAIHHGGCHGRCVVYQQGVGFDDQGRCAGHAGEDDR